jgi:hypothetical protein
MGGEGHSVPRYLVSRNRRYKDNERLILQEANIASCRVIFSLLASSSRGLMVWDNFQRGQEEMTMEIGRLMTRPCLMDLVLVGWNKLKEMNVKKIGW